VTDVRRGNYMHLLGMTLDTRAAQKRRAKDPR
jgi:hypothetical protein